MELKQRKENMIIYHKDHIMLPLMLLGAVAFMPALAAGAKEAPKERAEDLKDSAVSQNYTEAHKFKYNRSMEELAAILQRNLANIRIIAGLNADYYAKNMQVTRQAISQTENVKVKMSNISGMAWSTAIQVMANQFPDNLPLQKVCNLLLYGLNDYSDEELKEFGETIDRIVKAKKAGLDDKTLELLASNLPDIKVK